MNDFELPKLPEGYRYGADHSVNLPEKGEFRAPAGCVIKSINTQNGTIIYVPIQRYIAEKDIWVTVDLTTK
ncbi:hypothetical protein [Escherichia coli]|uniref:hypothetical protein n=1 Tax=Escherichia coli TaxID=562 RepID=UPI000CFB326E|nr:hypothetical protein [Escherichia coli]WOZ56033.1 hypothetical protein B115_00045 [Yersinia phage vB_YpM_115]WOZ56079.1 hypothetical protein B117_00045 [Yersinia phage vB_YpM_117]EJP1041219.1 hypothetical protein [Escherichia coli]EKU3738223.1 hypothetical protein [Escherichia coli]EKU3743033.1 hypothetical protein [Escherichia coli]